MSEILLYNYFRSSTSYRVRIALHLKALPFKYVPVHLLKDGGEQNKAEYRKINPAGGVPSLLFEGHAIAESRAIIEFIDDTFSQCPLYPTDPYLKARAKQICDHINTSMHPLGNLKVLQFLENEFGYSQEQKEQWVQHWLTPSLQSLEKLVKETAGEYCIGNQITVADLFLIPQLFTCLRFKVPLDSFPTLLGINERCLKQDAFIKAHPFRQIDTPDEFKIKGA